MTAVRNTQHEREWLGRLAEVFPIVGGLTGHQAFRDLAECYVIEHGRASPPSDKFGERFAGFLEDAGAVRDIPYLADMARLEWTHYESTLAPKADVLPPTGFSGVAPEALTYVCVTLHPAVRVLTTAYPVFDLWRRRQGGSGTAPLVPRAEETLLFTRKCHAVRINKLSRGAGLTLLGLGEGLRLGTAYEQAFARHAEFDLKALIALCLENGVFSALSLDRCPKFASDGIRVEAE